MLGIAQMSRRNWMIASCRCSTAAWSACNKVVEIMADFLGGDGFCAAPVRRAFV
jgi:hypothetical protein